MKLYKLVAALIIVGLSTNAFAGKGSKGSHGSKGSKDMSGLEGPQGETGPQGPAGADGAAGPAGADGMDGDDGADGANGADGAAGPAGMDAPDRTAALCALYNNLFDASMISPLEVPDFCVAPAPAPVEDEELSSLYSCQSSPAFHVFNGFNFQVVDTQGFLARVETRGPFRVTLSAQCSDGGTANEVYDFPSTFPPGVGDLSIGGVINTPCTLGNSRGFGICTMRVPFMYDLYDSGGLIPFCDPDSFFLEATVTLTPLPAPTGIPQLVGSLQCNFGPSGDG